MTCSSRKEAGMWGLEWWYLNWHWLFRGVVLAVLVLLVIQWIRISSSHASRFHDLAGQILRLRYFRGEIDKQEYERRLSALRRLQGNHNETQNRTDLHTDLRQATQKEVR